MTTAAIMARAFLLLPPSSSSQSRDPIENDGGSRSGVTTLFAAGSCATAVLVSTSVAASVAGFGIGGAGVATGTLTSAGVKGSLAGAGAAATMPDGTGTGLGRFRAAGAVTGLSLVVEGASSFEDSAAFRITEAIGSA